MAINKHLFAATVDSPAEEEGGARVTFVNVKMHPLPHHFLRKNFFMYFQESTAFENNDWSKPIFA